MTRTPIALWLMFLVATVLLTWALVETLYERAGRGELKQITRPIGSRP